MVQKLERGLEWESMGCKTVWLEKDTAVDPDADYAFVYDNLGRATSITADYAGFTSNIVMAQSFDANSNRTQLAATIGSTADFVNDYLYDNLARNTRIERHGVTGGNSVAETRVNLAYNAVSQFSTITRYADVAATDLVVTSSFGYDVLNRLTSLDHTKGATNLATYDFTFDRIDRITSVDSLIDGLASYSYDATSQLTAADFATQTDETHAWDANGNPTGGSFTVGTNNRLLSDGVYDYEYDDEGNRTKRTKISDGSYTEYSWDHRNRLVRIANKNSGGTLVQDVEYVYDFLDHLISREIDPDGAGVQTATSQWFAYDGQQMVLSFSTSAATAPANRYLSGPVVDQYFAAEDSSGSVLYPLGDHLNTYRDIAAYNAGTDTTTVANHIDFDSFHKVLSETNSAIDFVFGETGRFYDEATGQNFHNARWLDALARRWMSEDPSTIHSGDMNFARFVGNNTPNAIDPTGLELKFVYKKVPLERGRERRMSKEDMAEAQERVTNLLTELALDGVGKGDRSRLRQSGGVAGVMGENHGRPEFSWSGKGDRSRLRQSGGVARVMGESRG